jgi:hypothetical protein
MKKPEGRLASSPILDERFDAGRCGSFSQTSTTKGTRVHEEEPQSVTFVALCVLRDSGFSRSASSK